MTVFRVPRETRRLRTAAIAHDCDGWRCCMDGTECGAIVPGHVYLDTRDFRGSGDKAGVIRPRRYCLTCAVRDVGLTPAEMNSLPAKEPRKVSA